MNELDLSKYRKDAKGNLVPVDNIKEMDLLRDELVMELAGKARLVQEKIVDFKRGAVEDIAAFVQLSADRYDVSLGGKKGNVTLHSFDGQYRVNLAMQDTLVFDEGLLAANTTVNGLLTYTAGLSAVNSGGGDAANIEGTMVVNGEIILNGIPLSKHKHPGDSGGKTGLPE